MDATVDSVLTKTPSPPPAITASDLIIGYGQKAVIRHALQLNLYSGKLTSLLGLNGAGKSTLLRTLCGFQPPLSGEVRVNDIPLPYVPINELSRLIGVVLTERIQAGGVTVRELVSLGRHPYTGFLGRLRTADRRIVDDAIAAAGLTRKAANYIAELSDGERQKAMIAKALAQECPVIILDEPTAFLDVTARMEMTSLLHRLASEQGKAILLSTHDLDLAIRMSDCLWLLQTGKPLLVGAPEDLILDGSFAGFIEKEGVTFDPATGRLTVDSPLLPIKVEGDPRIAYWVGNALVRNGYQPSSGEKSAAIHILCESPQRLQLSLPARSTPVCCCRSVEDLVCRLREESPKFAR